MAHVGLVVCRHKAQAPRRREHPTIARPDRRPADVRERAQSLAVCQPRAHPRGRRARPPRAGPQDHWAHAAHRRQAKRPGRPGCLIATGISSGKANGPAWPTPSDRTSRGGTATRSCVPRGSAAVRGIATRRPHISSTGARWMREPASGGRRASTTTRRASRRMR
jgi:hypothetical protein